jgi:hypothetical protein
MFEKFNPEARRVVVHAQEDARGLNHDLITPEHLLISLTRDEGIAGRALDSLYADTFELTDVVAGHYGRATTAPAGNIPFSRESRSVLERAHELHLHLGHPQVGPEHILMAMTSLDGIISPEMYVFLGTTEEKLQELIATLMVRGTEPADPTGPFTFHVQIDRYGTVHGGSAASNSRKAKFTLHPGEFFSVSQDGTVDESVRLLDYAAASKIADQNYADVVILTSRQKDIDAIDRNGVSVKVGEVTVWTPEPISSRVVLLG